MNHLKAKVLLIEDDLVDAEVVERFLTMCDQEYHVTRANCLIDAKALLTSEQFDIVITDIGLPDCERLEPVEFVRSLHRSMAIIVLSGDSNESCYVDAIRSGADEFICKNTLDRTKLQRSLQQSIQRVKEQQTLRTLVAEVERQNKELENKSLELESKNLRLNALCDSSRVFVNHVSHEFRTPLCVIKQYAS